MQSWKASQRRWHSSRPLKAEEELANYTVWGEQYKEKQKWMKAWLIEWMKNTVWEDTSRKNMPMKRGQCELCKAFENIRRSLWVVVPVIIYTTDCVTSEELQGKKMKCIQVQGHTFTKSNKSKNSFRHRPLQVWSILGTVKIKYDDEQSRAPKCGGNQLWLSLLPWIIPQR